MFGSDRWTRSSSCLGIAATLVLGVAAPPAAVQANDPAVASTRLRHPEDRVAVVEAIRGAARRLAGARCRALLDTFTDADGRSLNQVLDGEGLAAADFLGRLFFYDGAASHCGDRHLAYTGPRSRVVFVCGRTFRGLWQQNPDQAEAAIIHETLHCLGLGENPPSWDEITERVRDACRQ